MKTWDRSELSLLALKACTTCGGTGVRLEREEELIACRCALRGAFRACYDRFRACAEDGRYVSQVSFDRTPRGRTHRGMWGRKEEEFMADFEMVARRVLDKTHYKLFRFHFLLGGDCSLYRRRKGGDRGSYFHALYRIEELLGWAFASLEPYPLFPVRAYFGYRIPSGVTASRGMWLGPRGPRPERVVGFGLREPLKISA